MSKKSNKWVQISNFLLGIENAASGNRLVVKSVSGDWRLMWEEGTMMYAVLLNFIRDEKTHDYVHALLTLFFAATNYPHDMVALVETQKTPFINGFTKLLNEQTDFEVSVSKKNTPEEDDAALKEVGEMEEIKEMLNKENGTE